MAPFTIKTKEVMVLKACPAWCLQLGGAHEDNKRRKSGSEVFH